MKDGLLIARKTGNGYSTVHIEEEVLWFAKLNRMTGGRLAKAAQQQAAEQNRLNAQRAQQAAQRRREAMRIRATIRMLKAVALMSVVSAAMIWAVCANLVSVLFTVPVLAICVSVATYHIGLWMGRRKRKENYYD